MNPMGLCDPWIDDYLHSWIKPPNLDHQNLTNLLSTTVVCESNLDETLTK